MLGSSGFQIWRLGTLYFGVMFFVCINSWPAITQELKRQAPKTQLEAFTGENGVVVIKGYTEVGSVSGTGKVDVTAMTFRNANTGKETSGIVVEVKSAAAYSTASRSFVDYDEIAGLLTGMEYVYRSEESSTKLKNFEATYSTKGELKVTVFSVGAGKRNATIQVGAIGSSQVFFGVEKLPQFAQLIIKAKGILDNPDTAGEAPAHASQKVIAPERALPSLEQPKPTRLSAPVPKQTAPGKLD
jgi:hypothetical protein